MFTWVDRLIFFVICVVALGVLVYAQQDNINKVNINTAITKQVT